MQHDGYLEQSKMDSELSTKYYSVIESCHHGDPEVCLTALTLSVCDK